MVRRLVPLLLIAGVVLGPAIGRDPSAAQAPAPSPTPAQTRSPQEPNFRPGSRESQLQAVLDARAGAVRSRDRRAFLSTVDAADPSFADGQAAWFDRLQPVPVEGYELRLLLGDSPELTRTRDRERYGVPVVVAPVEERFRFTGYGDRPIVGVQFLTFVRRQGRWRVASDRGTDDLGLRGSRHLWDHGEVAVHSSEHFLLLVHPEDAPFAGELLAQAEQALPAVGEVWKGAWDMHVPVEVPATAAELDDFLGGGLDVGKFVAFAVSSVDPDNDWRWDGARIIVNRTNLLLHPASFRRAVLAHELLHVATQPERGAFQATFVEEGLADLAAGLVGGPALDRQVHEGRFNRRLPEEHEFVSGTPEDIQAAYQKASSALAFMRDRYGIDAVNRFYRSYAGARVEPGTARYLVERAAAEALGTTLAAFEAEWAGHIAPAG
jgi:hypothetical protein